MHFDSQSTSHLNAGCGRSRKENLNQLIGRKLELLITLNAKKDDPVRGQWCTTEVSDLRVSKTILWPT